MIAPRRRYLLIGSGIAALAAAERIRACDPAGHITLVSGEPHAFYSRPGLAYYLTREVPEGQLVLRSAAETAELELERITAMVRELRPAAHEVQLTDGRTLPYDRLLLATGAASLEAPFAPAGTPGIVRLDGLGDARAIAARLRPGLRAVVVGGGSTALELVEGCIARGVRTHYLLRGERYWPRMLDDAESALVEARLERAGVVFHRGSEGARIEVGRNGVLRALITSGGTRIRCEVLAVAIGVAPRTALAAGAGIEVGRGVVVGRAMQTSESDVYAAGDVAEVRDGNGPGTLDTLWSSARRQGWVAGENLAGGSAGYDARPPLNVTRLAGIATTIVGRIGGAADADLVALTRGQSERWQLPAHGWTLRGGGEARVRLGVSGSQLAGGVIMGDAATARAVVQLVERRTDIFAELAGWQREPRSLPQGLQELARRSAPARVADG